MIRLPASARNSTCSFYGYRPSCRTRRLQSLFLALVKRPAQPPPAGAAQCREHLVGRHLADQQEQGGVTGLQRSRRLLHELVIDAEIGEPTPKRARSSPN